MSGQPGEDHGDRMKFDARTNQNPDERAAFLEWLVSETTSGLVRSAGHMEGLRAIVFLYLNRAYEAGLDADLICDLLGVTPDCILNRAGLSKEDEAAVMDAYDTLDELIEKVHSQPSPEQNRLLSE